jgi:hypothetical protein
MISIYLKIERTENGLHEMSDHRCTVLRHAFFFVKSRLAVDWKDIRQDVFTDIAEIEVTTPRR